MNNTQITLVKQSWSQVQPIAPVAASLFYDRLFSLAPGVRELFPADLTEQRHKLMKMIGMVVSGLDRIETILPALQRLGRRHQRYGAAPEHYDVVGECLLWTLGQGLGDTFTAEVEEAWAAAYRLLASAMMAAASDCTPELTAA